MEEKDYLLKEIEELLSFEKESLDLSLVKNLELKDLYDIRDSLQANREKIIENDRDWLLSLSSKEV